MLPWSSRKKPVKSIDSRSDQDDHCNGLKASTSLWDQAFVKLAEEKADLINRFTTVLAEHGIQDNSSAGSICIPSQEKLSNLVTAELSRMEERKWRLKLGQKSVEIRTQIDRILKIVLVAKDLGSSLASLDPIHAGLPWAGICLLLPLLVNDSQQRSSAIDGLEHVAKLIRRFAEVENVYIRQASAQNHRLRNDLQQALLKLYMLVLEYECRAISQFDRNTAAQAVRNIIKVDAWESLLASIKDAELNCKIITEIMDVEGQRQWNEKVEAMMLEQAERVERLLQITETVHEEPSAPKLKRADTLRDDQKDDTATRDCISSFRTTEYEFDKNKNPVRVANTCEWVLQHPVYVKWQDDINNKWLWITADPGCGKSVLSRFLVDSLAESNSSAYICYFFFKDDSVTNRNATHAFCALLHQLMGRQKSLVKYAMDAYIANGKHLADLMEQLWAIFEAIILNVDVPVICVLDALDECLESPRKVMLQRLAHHFSTRGGDTKLKLVMTSRPNTPIGDAIWDQGMDPMSISLTGEGKAESQAIADEIRIFIDHKYHSFERLRRRRNRFDDAHLVLRDKLAAIENRTYLWVYLIFEELEKHAGVSKKDLLKVLDEIPPTVEDAYEKILQRSLDKSKSRKLLHFILAAKEPLSLYAMNVALATSDDVELEEELDLDPQASFEVTVRELCGLFVVVKDTTLYLIHQTAREFLLTNSKSYEMSDDLTTETWRHSFHDLMSDYRLTHACVSHLYLLQNGLKVPKHNPKTAGHYRQRGTPSWSTEVYGFHSYALAYWKDHFRALDDSTLDLAREEFNFEKCPGQTSLNYLQMYTEISSWKKGVDHLDPLPMACKAVHYRMTSHFSSLDDTGTISTDTMREAVLSGRSRIFDAVIMVVKDVAENARVINAGFHIACRQESVWSLEVVLKLRRFSVLAETRKDVLGRISLDWVFGATMQNFQAPLYHEICDLPWSATDLAQAACIGAFRDNQYVGDLMKRVSPDNIVKAMYQCAANGSTEIFTIITTEDGILRVPIQDFRDAMGLLTFREKAPISKAPGSVSLLGHLELCGQLDCLNIHGETLLFEALEAKNINMIEDLLDRADVNFVCSSGWHSVRHDGGTSLLFLAVRADLPFIVAELILRQVDLDVRGLDGRTALFHAVATSNVEMVKVLLEANANPFVPDVYGHNALMIAEEVNDPKAAAIVSVLKKYMDQWVAERPYSCEFEAVHRERNVTYSQDVFQPLLEQIKHDIDVDVFAQIIEMGEPQDTLGCETDHEFSRDIISQLFKDHRQRYKYHMYDALIRADFYELYVYIGDFLKGTYASIGFTRLAELCDEVCETCRNRPTWVGCHPHGGTDAELDDVECLKRMKVIVEEINSDMNRLEKWFVWFYLEVQDAKYDAQPKSTTTPKPDGEIDIHLDTQPADMDMLD